MPSRIFKNLELVQGSTRTYTFDMYEADCDTAWGSAADDQVRFKLWQTGGAAPDLDLCDIANANDSRAYISTQGTAGATPTVATVIFSQVDTAALAAGLYRAELGFIDNSATAPVDAYTCVAHGRVRVIESATGDRDLAT